MFGFKFNIATVHEDESVKHLAAILKDYGFKIVDLREADIIKSCNSKFVANMYILQCIGPSFKYFKFKNQYGYDSVKYEGLPLLIGKIREGS